MDWLNALAGLLVGIVVGLTGVGGGSLMSPILILLFGVAPATAIGTDLWFAAITKSVGGIAHYRQGTADIGILKLLALGSIPAAIITGLILSQQGMTRLDGKTLPHILGVVLILTAFATLLRGRFQRFIQSLPVSENPRLHVAQRIGTVLTGVLLGALVTLTSIGAGALGATLLLALYPVRLSLRRLVGTDIIHAVPIALIGGMMHLIIGTVDLRLLGMLLLGSIPGILIGARLAGVVRESWIQPVLAVVLAISGYKLLT